MGQSLSTGDRVGQCNVHAETSCRGWHVQLPERLLWGLYNLRHLWWLLRVGPVTQKDVHLDPGQLLNVTIKLLY